MKIIATSDWHLGNLFHGNDRLEEHRDFLSWLLARLEEERPDALLVAGDVFDNGNPSAAAQEAYYEFLADATQRCPGMTIVITAGNHDSASRLEAPRALLSRHRVEIRGNVHREWKTSEEEGGHWVVNYEDLMIPLKSKDGSEVIVLAVPFLRSDIVLNSSYSAGVNQFLSALTDLAREKFPGKPLLMMAHLYATGATVASSDASEKIIVGGQEQVDMGDWTAHPDYLTCGHIHKRQKINGWARYTGSVLPMSFAECDYHHGVDLITFENGATAPEVRFIEYTPQHKLRVLPKGDEALTPKQLTKLIAETLPDRTGGKLDGNFVYLSLKVKMDKVNNDEIKEIEAFVETKNAVLCKIQKILPAIDLSAVGAGEKIHSVDDILNRDPLTTLEEAFSLIVKKEMSPHQKQLLSDLLKPTLSDEIH